VLDPCAAVVVARDIASWLWRSPCRRAVCLSPSLLALQHHYYYNAFHIYIRSISSPHFIKRKYNYVTAMLYVCAYEVKWLIMNEISSYFLVFGFGLNGDLKKNQMLDTLAGGCEGHCTTVPF
jgi:hypothetical protein